jgi:hypothetical protein
MICIKNALEWAKKVINSTKLHIWESFPAVQRGKNLDAGTPGNVLEEFVFKLNQDLTKMYI